MAAEQEWNGGGTLMSRMLSRGTERVRNASGTLPKTKTKTKYLILTFWGWLAFKDSGVMKAAIVALLTREAGTVAAGKPVRRLS